MWRDKYVPVLCVVLGCAGEADVSRLDVAVHEADSDPCNRDGQSDEDLGVPPGGCACALECPDPGPDSARVCDRGACSSRPICEPASYADCKPSTLREERCGTPSLCADGCRWEIFEGCPW